MKRLVILGAGTGGTVMANLLRKRLRRDDWAITVIDRDDEHYYQPGLPVHSLRLLHAEEHRQAQIEVPARRASSSSSPRSTGSTRPRTRSSSQDGRKLAYDYPHRRHRRRDRPLRNARHARRLAGHDLRFLHAGRGGGPGREAQDFPGRDDRRPRQRDAHQVPRRPARVRLFLRLVPPPPRPARQGSRSSSSRRSPAAFTKPVASKALGSLLEEKKIRMVTDFNAERVDAAARKLVGYDGREVPYDLLVTVPTNMGSEMIERSGMGDEFRFLPTDPKTLRSKKYENIFAIGDATDLPALQGRLRRPFPVRDPGREYPAGDRGQAARAGLRRPRQLLRRNGPAARPS